MRNMVEKYYEIEKYKSEVLHTQRLCYQLKYAIKLNDIYENKFEELIDNTLDTVLGIVREEGAITKYAVSKAETMLNPITKVAKEFQLFMVAHAHIDLNWRWGYDETVMIALDTFRTMLNLLDEYPEFKFSQSQAVLYEIVEKYDPEMLVEIRNKVKDGTWEATAAHWVEGEKNIPSGEALARQLLYAKKYISKTLEIDESKINIGFEPDTFGHNNNMPDILNAAGVNYYYHCRGYEKHCIYRWKGQGGKEVLVYRDPIWYQTAFDCEPYHLSGNVGDFILDFYKESNYNKMMKIYGVCDHGGGPSRADIEMILEMSKWPIFPEVKFSTVGEYFTEIEKDRESFPVECGELNPIFTGCYTSNSRLKIANRVGEKSLLQAETLGVMANNLGYKYNKNLIKESWKDILFNQFHDILPGCCTLESKEYAMGNFQKALAGANATKRGALRAFVSKIDTEDWLTETEDTVNRSEGAGIGFGMKNYKLSQVDRSRGLVRAIHVFNSTQYDRTEVIDVPLWHYPGNIENCLVFDKDNNPVPFNAEKEEVSYEGYYYNNLTLEVKVPAFGYSTYLVSYDKTKLVSAPKPDDMRVEKVDDLTFENDYLVGEFSKKGELLYLKNKITDEVMISEKTPLFRYVLEDHKKGGSAWITGNYSKISNIDNVRIKSISRNSLRTTFEFDMRISNSSMIVKVSLDKNKNYLDFDLQIVWEEMGSEQNGTPLLQFGFNHKYNVEKYIYDIPFGVIEREAQDIDSPGISFAVAKNNCGSSLMVMTDGKSGFRCYDNKVMLNLLRSFSGPDKYAEIGEHHMRFALVVSENTKTEELLKLTTVYQNTLEALTDKCKKGSIEKEGSMISVDTEDFVVTAVKTSEDNRGIIVRGYSTLESEAININIGQDVKEAYLVDILENNTGTNLILDEDNFVTVGVKKNEIITIKFYK